MTAPDFDATRLARQLQDTLGDAYSVGRPLEGGGMSAVFLATDHALGRTVVIKVLPQELAGQSALDRFRQEIRVTAGLQDPHIIPVLTAGIVQGLPYFIMPFVNGEALRVRLRRGPLSVEETVRILLDVAQALVTAHAHGVVHRDIKPGNILLTSSSAVVTDFGVAKATTGSRGIAEHRRTAHGAAAITFEGTSLGTPVYMAPEQAAGDPAIDARADLYALGCVAYEMLAGTPPISHPTRRQTLVAQLTESPVPLGRRRGGVPWPLEALIMACLAKDPTDRPASARDVVRSLQDPSLLTAPPASVSRPTRRASARSSGRASRIWGSMRILGAELRGAARALRQNAIMTMSAVASIALGLGMTTAVFSAVNRALLQPPLLQQPEQLITVFRTTPQFNAGPFSAPNYQDLARDTRQVAGLAALTPNTAMLEPAGGTLRVARLRITGNLLPLLRVRALHGRVLLPTDDDLRQPRVVVLGEAFWRERFAADTALIGQQIRVDGEAVTLVGILPEAFRVPHGSQVLRADVWEPMRFSPAELGSRGWNMLYVLGRLAPGATVSDAHEELTRRFALIALKYPDVRGESLRVVSLVVESTANIRKPLLLLFAAVMMVLLIAATNVVCLLLARSVHQQRELAIRTALGASRWALMRTVLAESLLLALIGAACAVGLAFGGVRVIASLATQQVPQLAGLTIDGRVLAFATGTALVIALACGLLPAWRSAGTDPRSMLHGGRGGGNSLRHHRALGALVIGEAALSLVLLVMASLVLRGFLRLLSNDPGFDPMPLLAMEVSVSPKDYADGAAVRRFLEPALHAVTQVPGVATASATSLMPYRDWGRNFNVRYEGQPADRPTALPLVESQSVTPSFFDVTGQRLLLGRRLTAADEESAGTPVVVVVNTALIKRDFAGRNPIGARFYTDDSTFATIVGVVTDIRNYGPVEPPKPQVYWSYRQGGQRETGYNVLIRVSEGDPTRVAAAVQSAIRSVDPRAAVTRVEPMTQVIAASLGRPRFILVMLGVFAMAAVSLAVAGLYGVLSYSVAQRTRELGIRAALGATPGQVTWVVTRRGVGLLGAGVGLGLAASTAVVQIASAILPEVSRTDPAAWVLSTGVLLVVGLLAIVSPARYAARADPGKALRAE